MSTVQSSNEHLTLNASGTSKDIKFQANGVEKASISSAGAFTSTTIDATKLTGNLPAIDGSSLTGVGKVLQVVSTTKTDTFSYTGTAFTDVTGLSATITPSSTSSKILITVAVSFSGNSNNYIAFKVLRGSTAILMPTETGTGVECAGGYAINNSGNNQYSVHKEVMTGLDSPSTTSATSYKVQVSPMRTTTQTAYINRSYAIVDDNQFRTTSTITVMEIEA